MFTERKALLFLSLQFHTFSFPFCSHPVFIMVFTLSEWIQFLQSINPFMECISLFQIFQERAHVFSFSFFRWLIFLSTRIMCKNLELKYLKNKHCRRSTHTQTHTHAHIHTVATFLHPILSLQIAVSTNGIFNPYLRVKNRNQIWAVSSQPYPRLHSVSSWNLSQCGKMAT